MKSDLSIGVIGEFDPEFPPHPATNAAIEHSAASLGARAEVRWLDTASLGDCDAAELAGFDALWCAPGSPYRSLDGAVRAIRLGREAGLPFLGTCGGFQHAVIEYARNVLGFGDAQHAEYDPYASDLFISQLSCSLAGQTMGVRLARGSRAARFYGKRRSASTTTATSVLTPTTSAACMTAGCGSSVQISRERPGSSSSPICASTSPPCSFLSSTRRPSTRIL